MNWLQRFAIKLAGMPAPDDDWWYGKVGSPTYAGPHVSENTSLQSTAVYACVRVIAETIASLPFSVYRRVPGGKEPAPEHPLHYVLHDSANVELTSFEFWEMTLAHLLTWGNSYARIEYGPRLEVRGLIPITPDRVTPKRDSEMGVRYYEVTNGPGKVPDVLFDSDLLHIPGLGYDGLRGYSPVQMMRQAIGMAMAAEEYGARFFANHAMPPAYVSVPGAVSNEVRERIKEYLKKQFGGAGVHSPGVFEGGAEIKTVSINHRDIQFLELRKFQLEEIARIYRVPLHLIQNLDRSTNNNIEHQSIDFAMHTIRPWLVRIERRVNKVLLGSREAVTYFAEFTLDALLRGDSASRAAYYQTMRTSGLMTANEIRAKENMNPVEGGDIMLVQGAMIPVEDAGKTQEVQP